MPMPRNSPTSRQWIFSWAGLTAAVMVRKSSAPNTIRAEAICREVNPQAVSVRTKMPMIPQSVPAASTRSGAVFLMETTSLRLDDFLHSKHLPQDCQ